MTRNSLLAKSVLWAAVRGARMRLLWKSLHGALWTVWLVGGYFFIEPERQALGGHTLLCVSRGWPPTGARDHLLVSSFGPMCNCLPALCTCGLF